MATAKAPVDLKAVRDDPARYLAHTEELEKVVGPEGLARIIGFIQRRQLESVVVLSAEELDKAKAYLTNTVPHFTGAAAGGKLGQYRVAFNKLAMKWLREEPNARAQMIAFSKHVRPGTVNWCFACTPPREFPSAQARASHITLTHKKKSKHRKRPTNIR